MSPASVAGLTRCLTKPIGFMRPVLGLSCLGDDLKIGARRIRDNFRLTFRNGGGVDEVGADAESHRPAFRKLATCRA